MMMAQEAVEDKVSALLEKAKGLVGYVEQAAREHVPVHELERNTLDRLLEMGRCALGEFFAIQGDGDQGETVTMSDGQTLQRLPQRHPRTYRSIFGVFRLERVVYGTREGQRIEWVPLDARLQLPMGEFSYVLQDWAQVLSVEHAFEQTAETLLRMLQVTIPVDSLERMNRAMAESVEAFRDSRPAPTVAEEGEFLVVTADAKGVPMRREPDQTPAGCRRKKGQKANKKQMATIGCVYSVDPKHRTAEEVVAALFRERRPEMRRDKDNEPTAQQKRVWSSLSYQREEEWIDGEEVVFEWLADEVAKRRYPGQPLICLTDGQNSLRTARVDRLPQDEDTVDILDLLHVTPRLWEAAYLFHAEGSDAAAAFVRARLLAILQGRAGYVVGGLRQMGTRRRLRGSKSRKLQTICDYLASNLDRMHYDRYLAEGYPIATGVIEGACRHVVRDRMERAGMRWTVEGAQAMLDLRTTYLNGQWEDFQIYRIEQERQWLYPAEETVQILSRSLPA